MLLAPYTTCIHSGNPFQTFAALTAWLLYLPQDTAWLCTLPYLACKTSSFQYILNHLHGVCLLHYNGFSANALESFEVALTK